MDSYIYDESMGSKPLTENINIPKNSDKLIKSLNTLLYDFNKTYCELSYKLNTHLFSEKFKSKMKNLDDINVINDMIKISGTHQDNLIHKTDEIYILESRILEFFDYPYKIFSKYKNFLVSMLDIEYNPGYDKKRISQPNEMGIMMKYLKKFKNSGIFINNKIITNMEEFCYNFVTDKKPNKYKENPKKYYLLAYKEIKGIRNNNHHSFPEINFELKYASNKNKDKDKDDEDKDKDKDEDTIDLIINDYISNKSKPSTICDIQKKIKYINIFINIIHSDFENLYNKILKVKNIENKLSIINCSVIRKYDNEIIINPIKVTICLDNNKWKDSKINDIINKYNYNVKFEYLNNPDQFENMIIFNKKKEKLYKLKEDYNEYINSKTKEERLYKLNEFNSKYQNFEINKFYNYDEIYKYLITHNYMSNSISLGEIKLPNNK